MRYLGRETLAVAVDAADALFQAVGIEGNVVIDDPMAMKLEVNALASAVGSEQDANGSTLGRCLEGIFDSLPLVFILTAVQKLKMLAAQTAGLDQVLASIESQKSRYAALIGAFSEAELRGEVEMFFRKASRGAMIVNMVLCGCAAYRTQLFLYLKACGREELGTVNLWGGMDAVPA